MTTLLEAARALLFMPPGRSKGEYRPTPGGPTVEEMLRAAIAAAESAPAVVTAEEVHRALRDPSSVPGYTAGYGDEAVAVLVNARIAAAVAAARAEERERAAGIADRAVCESANAALRSPEPSGGGDYSTRRHHEECAETAHRIAAAIRGQSEAPAPERLHGNGAAWTPAQKVSRLEAEIESLHAEADRLRARESMAAEVLRLVPRARGDHRAGCPAGIDPQATGTPQGTRRCACHVDPVRTALGEPTTDEELAGR